MNKFLFILFFWVLQANLYAESNKLGAQEFSLKKSYAENEIPLSKSNQSDISILAFANKAILATFSYDYKDHDEVLKTSSKFFTKKGWKKFLIALENSNNLNTVIKKKLTVSAIPIRSPIIINKGVLNGVYSWKVVMPITIKYQNSSKSTTQKDLVTVLIARTPKKDSLKGIGIIQFVAGPYMGFE